MEYAWQHPLLSEGTKRPIVESVGTALRVEFFDYLETRRRMRVDPDTGLLVERRPDNT